jgi:hypothetical protein
MSSYSLNADRPASHFTCDVDVCDVVNSTVDSFLLLMTVTNPSSPLLATAITLSITLRKQKVPHGTKIGSIRCRKFRTVFGSVSNRFTVVLARNHLGSMWNWKVRF